MQIAKINAEMMLPKGCMDANSNEVINTENNVGKIIFNLFNKTPLKINSSEIGEITTVAIKLPIAIRELFRYIEDNWKLIKDPIAGNVFKIKLDKYRNP